MEVNKMPTRNRFTPKAPIKIQEPKTVEESKEVKEEAVEVATPEPEKVEEPEVVTVDGEVSGVNTALNIRKKPEVKANNQIGVVGRGTKLIIVDPDHPVKKDGEEWYKVLLNGEPGYAMKKYIIIK